MSLKVCPVCILFCNQWRWTCPGHKLQRSKGHIMHVWQLPACLHVRCTMLSEPFLCYKCYAKPTFMHSMVHEEAVHAHAACLVHWGLPLLMHLQCNAWSHAWCRLLGVNVFYATSRAACLTAALVRIALYQHVRDFMAELPSLFFLSKVQ